MKIFKEKPYLVYHSETEKNYFKPEKRIKRDNTEYLIGNYQQNNLYDREQLDSTHEVEVKIDGFKREEYIEFMGQVIFASKYKR
ncbi:hypothetical protein ACWN8V_07045 [Vagococcus elongatus]|uniref:Uncharacterized protein n=1 Tax=Vagococcus elongatus TaxID=180344 RepID=A0A430AW59_9ENTE|nr:hypothetical protein [Vagococcus elongatus]RSU12289.1 hypothetical protein CBF29_06725 [Vagococcus elongatus]